MWTGEAKDHGAGTRSLVALRQPLCQLTSEGIQFGDPSINDLDPCLEALGHAAAGARRPQALNAQKLSNVVEGQTNRLCPPNEMNALRVRLSIESIARIRSMGRREQTLALVKAQGVARDVAPFGQITDSQSVVHLTTG